MLQWNRIAVGVLILLMGMPGFATAAESSAKNPLDPNLVNSVVTVVVFLCLLGVLYRFAWGPIQKSLKEREELQFKALEDARLAREEAAAMRKEIQSLMAKAHEDIRAMMEEARRDAEALRQREKEVGVKEAEAERERAKREIQAAKEVALSEIYQKAVDLATVMSAKAISRTITPEDHQRLLEESVAELVSTYPTRA